MKHQAEHDSLTELLNRRSFDQLLSLYEKDRSSFALILADVDVFKQINDTCGHDTGDRILKRVAALRTPPSVPSTTCAASAATNLPSSWWI